VGEVLRHPMTIGILAPIVVATVLAAGRLLRRIADTAAHVDEYVLPHFAPAPGRTTLPGAVERLRNDLTTHMSHEEELRATEIQRRDSWRQEIDHRFDRIEEGLR
jgi:hypothetical protein